MFPSARSMEEIAGSEAEERRLFYVAVTRARTNYACVFLRSGDKRWGMMYYLPSRFIDEIPREMIKDTRAGFYLESFFFFFPPRILSRNLSSFLSTFF